MATDLLVRVLFDDQISAPLKKIGSEFESAGKRMALAGGAITAGLTILGKQSVDFQEQMSAVSTMLDTNAKQLMPAFKTAVLDMSAAFGEGTDTLSKGLYDILSASIPTEQAIGVLKTSVLAAKAGFTETGVAADALTTIINSYGFAAEDAGDVSDWMFGVVKRGKTTFEEIAGTIGRVSSIASSAGLSLEELGGLLAVMTRSGISTEEAVTSLRGVLTAFLKPTDEAKEAAKALGVELSTDTLATEGLIPTVQKLTGATNEQQARIFGNVRALAGMASVLKNVAGFEEDVELLTKRSGRTMEAFGDVIKTASFSLDTLWKIIKVLAVEIGTTLLPDISEFATLARNVIGNIIVWVRANEGLVRIILTVAAAVGVFLAGGGALLIIFGSIATSVAALLPIFGLLFTAFVSVVSVIAPFIGGVLLAVGVIGGLILVGKSLVDSFGEIKAGLKTLWQAFSEFGKGVVGIFKGVFLAVTGHPKEAFETIKGALENFKTSFDIGITAVGETSSAIFSSMKDNASQAFDGIKEKVGNVTEKIKGFFSGMTESSGMSIKNFAENTVPQAIESMSRSVLAKTQTLKDQMREIWAGFGEDLSAFWGSMTEGFGEATLTVQEFGSAMFSGLRDSMGTMFLDMTKGARDFAKLWNKFLDNMAAFFFKSVAEMTLLWITSKNQEAKATLAWQAISIAATLAWKVVQTAALAAATVGSAILSVFRTVPWFLAIPLAAGVAASVWALFRGLQEGGIVTAPILAQIGEGGEPEAVVPLSRAQEFGFGGPGAGAERELNVNIEAINLNFPEIRSLQDWIDAPPDLIKEVMESKIFDAFKDLAIEGKMQSVVLV